MTISDKEMQSFHIRKTSVAEGDKVRYRVYRSPSDFVAVIAENALMAVKVSGVTNPYKIMRDLPTSGISIDEDRIAPKERSTETVSFPLIKPEAPVTRIDDLPERQENSEQALFVPIGIADLQYKGGLRARILPPSLLHEIIEEHKQHHMIPVIEPMEIEPVATSEAAVEQEVSAEPLALVVEPTPSTEETITQLANEILPSAADAPKAALDTETLSPEEVQKLLNE